METEPRILHHIPVLADQVIALLDIQSSDCVCDGTLGAGGHAERILKLLDGGTYMGIDQDEDVLQLTTQRLRSLYPHHHIITAVSNFRYIDEVCHEHDIHRVDKILLDLGISSMQFDDPRYGMTFRQDAPLSMVMNPHRHDEIINAYDIVNTWSETEIADAIFIYGDERYSRRIARGIVQARQEKPIATTQQLADIIRSSVPSRYAHGGLHPATRTFQALRIVVNDEYGALEQALHRGIDILASKGRMAIISFHSGEDRIVKNIFKNYHQQEKIMLITKKPITPSDEEITLNPRARSAKLRIIEKL